MRPPEAWRQAPVTLTIAIVTTFAWLVTSLIWDGNSAAVWGGFIPARVSEGDLVQGLAPVWLTPLTATLIHAGLIHLVFNLIILLFCGRAIEPIVGRAGLVILYLVGAYASAAAQYFVDQSAAVPMVGASGAISAVLGAYAILFGRNRVKVANARLAVWLHALWLCAAWIFLQLLTGFTFETLGTTIAIAAHIGGFIVGMALAHPLLLFRYRKA